MSSISQRRASAILGVSPPTVKRMIERGDLETDKEGKLSLEEVEDFAAARDEEKQKDPTNIALTEMREAYQQSVQHAERLMGLIEKPMHKVLATIEAINSNLVDRLNHQEDTHLEMLKVLGDILLQKEERDAVRKESEVRSETLRKAGGLAAQYIPTLMQQFGGDKAKMAETLEKFKGSLTDEQKEGLGQLAGFFEGEQREMFEAVLKTALGVEIPAEKPEQASEGGSDDKADKDQ